MSCQREVRTAVAACLLGWLALAAPWLWGSVTIPYDATAHFQPQLQFLARSLASGQSPFWNPHVFGGSPQVADPQSLIFSPVIALAALVPDPGLRLLDAYVLGLLALAAVAILLYFRERGWHPAAGVVAALAFAFGASASWRLQHIGQVQSLALFAIALLLLHRALERRTLLSAVAAGLACGVLLIEPNQVALMAAYALAGYAVAHVLGKPDRLQSISRHVPTLALAGAVALLVCWLPLLLLAQFAASTSRAEIPFAEAASGSLHPASLLTLLIGDLYGAGTTGLDYWGPYSESWTPKMITLSQNMSQLYAGALPALAILVLGIGRGWAWRREIRAVSILGLCALIYALGSYTPIFRLLYDFVPGVAVFRRPADATFMIGGLGAIVAGYLVHCWMTETDRIGQHLSARRQAPVLGLVGLVGVLAVAVAVNERALLKAMPALLFSAGLVAAAAAALWLARQPELRAARYSVPLLAGLMTLDLAAINGPNESTALPSRQFEAVRQTTTNETVAWLKARLAQPPGSPRRDRVELAGIGFDWPNLGMVHGFDHTLGYNPLRLDVISEALGADDTIAGWDQRRFTPLFPSYRSRLADMMGLRYVISGVPLRRFDKRLRPWDLRLVARTREGFIYVNPRALPRAMFVPDWQTADFAALIRTGEWPTVDPRRVLLLETAPPAVVSSAVAPLGGSPMQQKAGARTGTAGAAVSVPTSTTVRLERYENTRVEISVEAPRSGFVLLNDVWHPWWRATLDGQPADVLKANVLFRAVAVPAGRHRIVFSFEPIAGAIAAVQAQRARLPSSRQTPTTPAMAASPSR